VIKNNQKPYNRILKKLQKDSYQYRNYQDVLQRAVQYVWFYQTNHAIEIDMEGMNPVWVQDELYQKITEWTRSQECFEWLCQGKEWPNWFNQQLIIVALQNDWNQNSI